MRIEDIKFEPVLWDYDGPLENGEFSIYLRFSCYGEKKYLGTKFSSSPDHWDRENNLLLPSHPQYREVLKKIDQLKDDVKFEIRLADQNGVENVTLEEIKRSVKSKQKPAYVKHSKKKIYEYFDEIIKSYEEAGKPGYADVYTYTKQSLEKVLKKDKTFFSFKKEDCEAYEKYLTDSVRKEITISFYLRTFYRLWNLAIAAGHCPKDHHPKKYIAFKPYRKFKTKKRAVGKEYIKKLDELKFDPPSRKWRAQKFWLFSYYARGIEFCDQVQLKWTNMQKGILKYKRSKTGRDYEFKLHPKALEIALLFKENYPNDAGYIFPYLNSKHDTPRKIDQRIDSSMKDVNEDMRDMEKMIGSPKRLTTKVTKHSVASHLKKDKVDIKIIQDVLGHETEEQSNTYMEELDDDEVADVVEKSLA
jgi:integrase